MLGAGIGLFAPGRADREDHLAATPQFAGWTTAPVFEQLLRVPVLEGWRSASGVFEFLAGLIADLNPLAQGAQVW